MTKTPETANEAGTIAELAVRAAGAPQVVSTPGGREFLLRPHGYTHEDVTPRNKLDVLMPKLIEQGVTLQNAEALIAYLERYKGETSMMFADVEKNRIVGAIDYHAPDKAALIKHRAVLDLPYSEEWKTWSAIDGTLKPQLEFARFIEENAPDIKAPDAGTLLDAVRDLQAKRSVNFIKAVRTASDNENFEYNDTTEARTKGDIELPTKFVLGIPVYFGDPATEVQAFLRWRLDEGNLKLGIKLHRAEFIRQAAFNLIVTNAAERTGLLAVFGRLD
jgi:uncharacterized protein YfdQ (DUF2303 family)